MPKHDLDAFFAAYAKRSTDALAEPPIEDVDGVVASFAPYFVESSPTGVMGSENGPEFRKMIPEGFANYRKVADGGWVPLAVAGAIFLLMTTWERGRSLLSSKLGKGALSPALFVESLRSHPPVRVPGTAVFMHRAPHAIPSSLLHSLKHYKALHERVILLTIETEDVARLRSEESLALRDLGEGMHTLVGRFGYMESVDVPGLLVRAAEKYGIAIDLAQTTYFLGRETLVLRRSNGMPRWRAVVFASMMRNAESAARFFHLPANRVVELGAQIEL